MWWERKLCDVTVPITRAMRHSSCEPGKMELKAKIILFRICGFWKWSISSLHNYMFACCSFSAWSAAQIISGFLSRQFRTRELCGWGNGVGTCWLPSESKTGIPSITSKTVWQVTCSALPWFGFVETFLGETGVIQSHGEDWLWTTGETNVPREKHELKAWGKSKTSFAGLGREEQSSDV